MKQYLTMLWLAGAFVSAQAGGVYVSAAVPVYTYSSWGYSYPLYSPYGYYAAYSDPYYPVYGYEYSRPNYAVGGTLLGALTGGLIGASQHQGWAGAGIGAAAGLVLGSVAEVAAEKHEAQRTYAPVVVPAPLPAPVMVSPPVWVAPSPAPAPAPPPISQPTHQIPDAPRVPDAPTF